jgi:regulator of protease activity HflC (stomatin/prohibitin superfamily)
MEPILIVSATVLVVALALLAAHSRVPGGHVGMILRGGRIVRVATAGQRVVALPLVDTVRLIPVSPAKLELPALSALTRDGVRVDVAISVLWRVADPVALATGGDSRATACGRASSAPSTTPSAPSRCVTSSSSGPVRPADP